MKKVIIIVLVLLIVPTVLALPSVDFTLTKGSIQIRVEDNDETYSNIIEFRDGNGVALSASAFDECEGGSCSGLKVKTVLFDSVAIYEPGDYDFVIAPTGTVDRIIKPFTLDMNNLKSCEYNEWYIRNGQCYYDVTNDINDKSKRCNNNNLKYDCFICGCSTNSLTCCINENIDECVGNLGQCVGLEERILEEEIIEGEDLCFDVYGTKQCCDEFPRSEGTGTFIGYTSDCPRIDETSLGCWEGCTEIEEQGDVISYEFGQCIEGTRSVTKLRNNNPIETTEESCISTPVCGDGMCTAGETANNCAEDCEIVKDVTRGCQVEDSIVPPGLCANNILDLGLGLNDERFAMQCSCDFNAKDADKDGDGFDSADYVGGTDCNDLDPLVNPRARESCSDESGYDGIDNNCDDQVDLDCSSLCDKDGDGYYSTDASWYVGAYCAVRGKTRGDCNDEEFTMNPNPVGGEICGDGKNNFCNVPIYEDGPGCICEEEDIEQGYGRIRNDGKKECSSDGKSWNIVTSVDESPYVRVASSEGGSAEAVAGEEFDVYVKFLCDSPGGCDVKI